ncbi:MAG: FtsW/RodA/SpoVE family cell cycle protein [Rikenellaceae bacterium]|nr:FtsW/RodA/SpoVE family cell cycle protein [Rikenellaceae bacterium]MBR2419259.1 FtsW/RodA/SpoVE family cell cycle protein [Rikenellaceae bacterium]
MAKTTENQEEQSFWSRLFTGDRVLWTIVATLMVMSILVVYSSTAKMVYQGASDTGTYSYMFKQICFVGLGLGVMLWVHKVDYEKYRTWAWVVYGGALLLTIAAYVPGIGLVVNGARRWIPLGFMTLQPSELLKVTTIMILAKQLGARQRNIENMALLPPLEFWRWGRTWRRVKRILTESTIPILGPVVLSCAVILPAHTSSAALLFVTCWIMLAIGRVRKGELGRLMFLAIAAALLAMGALNIGRSDTAAGRMDVWISTLFGDEQVPIEDLSDTQRSMIAIYNGGLTGMGAGQSLMRVELIHPECDYAFAFIVEEYGLLFAILIMMLYLWIFYRCKVIFDGCASGFPSLLVLGLGLMITFQALVHILVTINFMPETGQPLPFISHGGSSIISASLALGMVLGVSRALADKTLDRPRSESLYEK